MESLKSKQPQGVINRGYVGDTNGDINYGRSLNDDYGNYLRQSGLEKLGRFSANILSNTALEAIRGVGSLYELGKRTAQKLDHVDENTGLNDVLFKTFDKDDNDFGNILTEFADKHQNAFGKIYTRNNDLFDTTSPSWWANNLQATLPTVLEFAGESALLGTGLGKAALKLGEFLNVGARGIDTLNKVAQGLTAFGVTKHESYMMAAQSYQSIYSKYLQDFEKNNPYATTQDKLKAQNNAKQLAGEGANYVDTIYTALALPFNITGLNSIFAKKADNIYDIFRTGAGKNVAKDLNGYRQQLESLAESNPFVQKALEKERWLGWHHAREAGFEGFEELEGQFAQKAGENRSKDEGTDLNAGLKQLQNFGKYTMNAEGGLNFFMGSFMGGAQTVLLENIPYHKVDKLNDKGNLEVVYKDGKPVVQTTYVNSRTRDAYGKQIAYNGFKDALIHDINHINGLQGQLAATTNLNEKDELRRQLFHIQALDSIQKGLGENFINSIQQIHDIDNSKSVAEPLKDQIGQLEDQLKQVPQNEDGVKQAKDIQANIDALNKEYLKNKDVTLAMQQGLATSKEDNNYKQRGLQAINEIKQIQKFYDDNLNRFTEQEKSVGLHQVATKLQADILGRERILNDHQVDLQKEKANVQVFDNVENVVDLDNAITTYQHSLAVKDYTDLTNALKEYERTKDEALILPYVDEANKNTWNAEELHANLVSQLKDRQTKLEEENTLLKDKVRLLASYQKYKGTNDDSDDLIKEFIDKNNTHSTGIMNMIKATHALNHDREKVNFLKSKLADIFSDQGKQKYKAQALKQLADLNEHITNQVNTQTYEQAKKENEDLFYVNKLKKLEVEQLARLNNELESIKAKIVGLEAEPIKADSIKSYFDSFIKQYITVKSNKELIEQYRIRLNYLQTLSTKINAKVETKAVAVETAKNSGEKQEIILATKLELDELFDNVSSTNTSTDLGDNVFSDEEINDAIPEEVKATKVEPVQTTTERIITLPKLPNAEKVLNGSGINPQKFIEDNYDVLSTINQYPKGKVKAIVALLNIAGPRKNYDADDDVDFAEAEAILDYFEGITVSGITQPTELTETTKKEVEEVKVQVSSIEEAVNDVKNTINISNPEKNDYIDTLFKAIINNKTTPELNNLIRDIKTRLKWNPSKDSEYKASLSIANALYEITKLDKYKTEIDNFNNTTEQLKDAVDVIKEPLVNERAELIDKQEVPKVQETPITNSNPESEDVYERSFQNELLPARIQYTNEQNGDVNPIYQNLLDPNYLNVGDTISIRVQTVGVDKGFAGGVVNGAIFKGTDASKEKFIGYIVADLYRLPKFKEELNEEKKLRLKKNEDGPLYLARIAKLKAEPDSKAKEEQHQKFIDALASLPDGTIINSKITDKSSGWHKKNKSFVDGSSVVQSRSLEESKLLEDNRIKLVLASNNNVSAFVELHDKNSQETLFQEDIGNIDYLKNTLTSNTLFISYPSAIPEKANLAAAYVSKATQDHKLFLTVLSNLYGEDKDIKTKTIQLISSIF